MGQTKKERLDVLVYEQGFSPSREKAKTLIMSGVVLVNGEREDKPGSTFPADVTITIKGNPLPYVSRGGLKLEKAMKCFDLSMEGKICVDGGASTGGFTDCMLQNGAVKVYSIDVGYGQLDWKLRNDERVVCMEKVNLRYLTPDMLEEACDFASIDVSFISLTKVLLPICSVLKEDACIVALIKPQFEAGREKVGKKGVVREKSTHREVIEKVIGFSKTSGLFIRGLDYSPVKGPEGNIEYLLYLSKKSGEGDMPDERIYDTITTVVENAHQALDH